MNNFLDSLTISESKKGRSSRSSFFTFLRLTGIFPCLTLICLIAGIGLPLSGFTQNHSGNVCGAENRVFIAGEKVEYKIYYTLAGVYIHSGDVSFSARLEQFNGKTVYHLIAEGKTLPKFDNFYKVRDKYESFIDTSTLRPYKFTRTVLEGKTHMYESINFDQSAGTAITDSGVYKVSECIHDVLSAMYYTRNLNFDQMHTGDKIQFTMFLGNKAFPSYIRYLGKEIIKTRYGQFHAIKFKPLLIKGTMFEDGEKMTVWVSDDANHLPLRVESPILVGKVKADMMDAQGLRMEMKSLINRR